MMDEYTRSPARDLPLRPAGPSRGFRKKRNKRHWTYRGILFAGFNLAEYRYFQSGDRLLVDVLNPVFNAGILVGFLYAVFYALILSRRITTSGQDSQ